MNQFLLMHKDKPVLVFSLVQPLNSDTILHVEHLINYIELPYGAKNVTPETIDESVTTWMERRCVPDGRPRCISLLKTYGLRSALDIIPYSYMCSLADCYWVKPANSPLAWKDVNIRDNGSLSTFDKHLFFMDDKEPISNWNSPDITTDGALPKTWQKIDGDYYLIKSSQGKMPMDVYNEIIATALLEQLGFDFIPYTLQKSDSFVSSACKCFIDSNNIELVPAENLLLDGYYSSISAYLETMRSFGFSNQVDSMLLIDYLIGNVDRHARNHGQIIDSETQQIIKLAPLFDHGGCDFFNDVGCIPYTPTKISFDDTLKSLSKDIIARLRIIDLQKIDNLLCQFPLEESHKTRFLRILTQRINTAIALL